MELEFDVKMTPNALYDYMLYHSYTRLSGILSCLVGLFMMSAFFIGYSPIYLIAGIVVVAYLPYTFFIRSRRQYLNNPAFKEPLHYLINDEGITVSQNGTEEKIEWELFTKAVSSPGSILLYTTGVNASIFPKKDLGEKKMMFIEAISTHMPPNKVKIRGN